MRIRIQPPPRKVNNRPVLGWILIALAAAYTGWLILLFAVAVPPPDYLLPRLAFATTGFFAGWLLQQGK